MRDRRNDRKVVREPATAASCLNWACGRHRQYAKIVLRQRLFVKLHLHRSPSRAIRFQYLCAAEPALVSVGVRRV